jgi:acyl-CoA reductase-like NAD-dependent aldehyde dehydrogenase
MVVMQAAREPIAVRNPRTGARDYSIMPPSAEAIGVTCAGLRRAQPEWGDAPIGHRINVMRRWADEIEKHWDRIAEAEAVDTARTRLSRMVPRLVVDSIRGWCDRAPEIIEHAHLSGTSSVFSNVRYETQLRPYQLIGIISPWNHPFLLSTLDAVPALLAGCAVIIKPSEIAPRFIEPVMETVRRVPELAKVLSFVAGDGQTGQDIIDAVDAICFTGSIPTGRIVARRCAERFIPAFLELGGKDAAIVTASADIERAAKAILRGAVDCTGQLCFATERVYVADAIYDAFVEALVRRSKAITISYPENAGGHLAPFILEKQAAIVDDHLDDATARGAKILSGGKSENHGGGLYMNATVVVDVTNDMKLMREETFGPVIPVMRFKTEDEAIALANDSEFGLSGAVIAGDEAEAQRIGRRLEAGAISLQDTALTIGIMRDVEKTAFQSSGLGGSRMGPNSLLRFFRKKALIVNTAEPSDFADFAEVTTAAPAAR